jgi:hypothetical protein
LFPHQAADCSDPVLTFAQRDICKERFSLALCRIFQAVHIEEHFLIF